MPNKMAWSMNADALPAIRCDQHRWRSLNELNESLYVLREGHPEVPNHWLVASPPIQAVKRRSSLFGKLMVRPSYYTISDRKTSGVTIPQCAAKARGLVSRRHGLAVVRRRCRNLVRWWQAGIDGSYRICPVLEMIWIKWN